MRKVFAIASTCCVLALALGLVGCGGSSGGPSSSGETSSGSAARAEAQAALDEGLGYWFGTGKNGYDKEMARAAFQQAADKGNAEGWYWLGQLRQHDVQADRWPQVVELYQKAADSGCAKGWCGLGRLYETGYGLEADVAKAAELYQHAIDAGELYGNVCLGYLYEKGKGVEASGAKAKELYELAVASDDFVTRNDARCAVGGLYNVGAEGLAADPALAREYYQAAADENYYTGWHRLANLYAATGTVYGQGAGFEADPAKEFEYESREAALGVVYPLGRCYLGGIGCDVDFAKAFELYTQEANGGRSAAWAMSGLAYLYATGSGVEKSYETAADWCNKSLAAACPGDDGIVEYANNMLAQIAESSQREAQA